jgi:hypothetical protein
MEQLCRWQQLVALEARILQPIAVVDDAGPDNLAMNGDGKHISSRLVAHTSDNALRPCSECLKSLPGAIFWESMSRSLFQHTVSLFVFLTIGWCTAGRSCFYGRRFWATSRGFALGSIFIFVNVWLNIQILPSKWIGINAPLVKLQTCIYHRAISLSLSSYLERVRRDLRAPPLSPLTRDNATPELFVQLHSGYVDSWQLYDHGNGVFMFQVFAVYPGTMVIIIVINIVSSRTQLCCLSHKLTFCRRLDRSPSSGQ